MMMATLPYPSLGPLLNKLHVGVSGFFGVHLNDNLAWSLHSGEIGSSATLLRVEA